jgi:hypothetical protein
MCAGEAEAEAAGAGAGAGDAAAQGAAMDAVRMRHARRVRTIVVEYL